jgi:hypothetical protein
MKGNDSPNQRDGEQSTPHFLILLHWTNKCFQNDKQFFFFFKVEENVFQLKIIQDLKFGYKGKGIAEYEKQDRLVFACESTDGRTVHLVLMDLLLRRQNHKRCWVRHLRHGVHWRRNREGQPPRRALQRVE